MSTTATRIRQISLVCVPTPDQDSAIAFYESVGFEKRTDTPFGGDYRWVEVYPPEGTTGIALAPPMSGQTVEPMQTGITLTTDDIDATLAELKSRGVVFERYDDMPGERSPSGAITAGGAKAAWFKDSEGNSFVLSTSK